MAFKVVRLYFISAARWGIYAVYCGFWSSGAVLINEALLVMTCVYVSIRIPSC